MQKGGAGRDASYDSAHVFNYLGSKIAAVEQSCFSGAMLRADSAGTAVAPPSDSSIAMSGLAPLTGRSPGLRSRLLSKESLPASL